MKAKVTRGSNFAGLLRYARDIGPRATGKKGGRLVGGNIDLALSCAKQANAFQSIAHRRPDTKRPVLHISLSLPAGERLTDERWNDIAVAFLLKMGINTQLQQYAVVRHEDTEFEHIHIIVNRVGIDRSLWLGRWEMKKAMTATTELESEFGLNVTPAYDPSKPARKKQPKNGAIGILRRTGELPTTMKIQACIDTAKAQSQNFSSFVAALAGMGVSLLPAGKTGSVPGVSFEFAGLAVKGSGLGRDYAWKSIALAVNFDSVGDAALIASLRAKVATPSPSNMAEPSKIAIKPAQKLVCSVSPMDVTHDSRQLFKRRLVQAYYHAEISDHLARLLKAVVLDGLPKSLLLRLQPTGVITDYGEKITVDNGTPNEITALVELARVKGWGRVLISGDDRFIENCALAFMRAGKVRTQIQTRGRVGNDAVERAWATHMANEALKKSKQQKEISDGNDHQSAEARTTRSNGTAGIGRTSGSAQTPGQLALASAAKERSRPSGKGKIDVVATSSKSITDTVAPAKKQPFQKPAKPAR